MTKSPTAPVSTPVSTSMPNSTAVSFNKKKTTRCSYRSCKKKVNIVGFTCRCSKEFVFCSKHLNAHECTFDFRKDAQERIKKDNPIVIASKIDKIN